MADWIRALLDRMPWLKRVPVWTWWLVALIGLGALALLWDFGRPAAAGTGDLFEPVGWDAFFGVLLKLGVVIALIYLGLFALKRWRIPGAGEAGKRLTMLETLRVSPRQTVYLLRAEDRLLVVGGTDQTMTLLADWTEGEGESFADIAARV